MVWKKVQLNTVLVYNESHLVQTPERKREWEHEYYHSKGKERRLQRMKEYYQKNKERIKSNVIVYYHKNREECNARHNRWLVLRKDDIAKYRKRYRLRLIELLTFGDYDCMSCGYNNDSRALQVDHIDGHGGIERRRFRNMLSLYQYYLSHEDEAFQKLQVLCANCNMIKFRERQEWG